MQSETTTYITKERRIYEMQDVRNVLGKLACKLDRNERVVEIVQKGCKTVIQFKPDGTVKILNTKT